MYLKGCSLYYKSYSAMPGKAKEARSSPHPWKMAAFQEGCCRVVFVNDHHERLVNYYLLTTCLPTEKRSENPARILSPRIFPLKYLQPEEHICSPSTFLSCLHVWLTQNRRSGKQKATLQHSKHIPVGRQMRRLLITLRLALCLLHHPFTVPCAKNMS